MVGTIAPRIGEKRIWKDCTILPFCFGAVVGGVVTFSIVNLVGRLIAAGLGWVPGPAAIMLIAVAALAYGISYVIGRPLPVPKSFKQVPKAWREAFTPAVAALLYGFGLGLGFGTKVPFVPLYLALLGTALTTSSWMGPVAGVLFGIGRSLPLVLLRSRGITFESAPPYVERILSRRMSMRRTLGVALVLLAVTQFAVVGL